jgi:uncharacterized BrkB/YihY/UPF0761 family membrane protein
MADMARRMLSSMRENPYKKQLVNTLMFLTVGAFVITIGAIVVDDQGIIKTADNSKTSDFKYWTGITSIVLGCLVILYLIYSFFAS